jgi:hypothetical protein
MDLSHCVFGGGVCGGGGIFEFTLSDVKRARCGCDKINFPFEDYREGIFRNANC